MLLTSESAPAHQNAPSATPSRARASGIMSGASPHAHVCTVSAWLSGRLQWRWSAVASTSMTPETTPCSHAKPASRVCRTDSNGTCPTAVTLSPTSSFTTSEKPPPASAASGSRIASLWYSERQRDVMAFVASASSRFSRRSS